MRFISVSRIISLLSLSVLLSLLTVSCSHDDHDHGDHAEAEGVELTMNGQTIVNVVEGQVTGSITAPVNGATSVIQVRFVAPDGDKFTPEEQEYSLDLQFADTSLVSVQQQPEDGKWSFRVSGKKVGSTSVVLRLLHSGHADFRTPSIPVNVTE